MAAPQAWGGEAGARSGQGVWRGRGDEGEEVRECGTGEGQGGKNGRYGERGGGGAGEMRSGGGSARAIKSRLFVRADGFGVGGEAGFGMSAGRVCNERVFLSGVRRPVDLRRTGTCVPAGSVFR